MNINRVTLVGRVGADPKVQTFQNGGKLVNFTLATSRKWGGDNPGEATQWHRVVVKDSRLQDLVDKYVRKGQLLYLEGALEYRTYKTDKGAEATVAEVILAPFNGTIQLGPSPKGEGEDRAAGNGGSRSQPQRRSTQEDLDDDIPF